MTVARKPLTGEITYKPWIASAALYARVRNFLQFAHEIAGAARIRHSLRPLISRGRENNLQTSGASCRENAHTYAVVVTRHRVGRMAAR